MNEGLNFIQPKDAWDKLSLREKAAMMKVAVKNGITNLQDIRKKYNEFAEGGDTKEEEYLSTMEKVAEDNYRDWGFSNPDEALVHALNDNTYNYRDFYRKYPWSEANATTHWTDEFKTVYHPTFSNESIYSGQKSQYNPLGLPGGFWSGDTFIPMAWQVDTNEYKKGGGIHIAPSKRGTFTAAAKKHGKSVQAFASQVLAHPENYSPAMRKKANFARNARKWKHGDGGPLVNLFYPGGTITYGKPFYSYDENGNKVDDTLNYNGLLSDIIIIPDNQKSPADRNEDERYRQRTQNDYAEQKSRDYTKKQIIAAQKDWENSIEKRVLDYAQAAASGIGIGADIVSGLPIYSSLRGAKVLSEAEAPMDYVEGGLWLSPLIGEIYQTAKPMAKQAVKEIATAWDLKNPQVPEGFLDITPKIEQSNAKLVFAEKPVTIAETVKAGERGRNKLINRVSSDWYTHRWEEAAPFENTDIVINDIINDVKDAPIDYSLSKYQLDPSGLTYGKTYAIQLNPDKITLPDGTIVSDYNTGLGIKVAADIGENAENTAMHELIHYSTGNSYGLSSGTVKPTMGGLLDPVGYKYDLLNPKQIIIPRGKRYQHFMVDYNENLLPKEDPKSIYNLIINNPSEAERKLIDTGLTVKEAKKKIQEMLPDAEYYTNKQEQQTFLKTWFFDKVVPKLKDPNNASEIEKYLLEHPEAIQKDYYVNTLMNTVRPGSTKQYAKALSKMLSTIYAASKIKDLTTE